MNYNPVGWFEIPANDIERAKKFYETLLGITMTRKDQMGYEMVWFPMGDVKGASGAIMKGPGYDASTKGVVIYFTCPDMEDAIKRAEGMGSKVVLPIKDIGEYGQIAWVTDSEGNVAALHRAKK